MAGSSTDSDQAGFYFDLAVPECHLVAERILHTLPVACEWRPVLAAQLAGAGTGFGAWRCAEEREIELERLEREAARAERLYAAGAAPLKRLEEARHDLEVVRAELTAMGAGTEGDYHLRVRSPIGGVIASRSFVPGGRVEAGEALFTVVDPSTVWLRVRMPADDASGVAPDARATFTVEGSDARRAASRLVSVGSVLDPETRTVPVVFEVENADGSIKIGQFASATVPVGGTARGIAIPSGAVLDDAGTSIAYVQAEGETFERRVLSLGESDGAYAIVLSGIREGERVVTAGAYQVRLASLSDVPLSGGHAH